MIRELRDDDVEAYVELRREALLDSPLAFAASPADDLFSFPEAVREQLQRAPEAVIIGAFRPVLVGAVGLYRDQLMKSSHKAHLWGMYVTPNHRRQGVASELLDAVLRHAARLPGVTWVHLKVSSAAPSDCMGEPDFAYRGQNRQERVMKVRRLPITTWPCV